MRQEGVLAAEGRAGASPSEDRETRIPARAVTAHLLLWKGVAVSWAG